MVTPVKATSAASAVEATTPVRRSSRLSGTPRPDYTGKLNGRTVKPQAPAAPVAPAPVSPLKVDQSTTEAPAASTKVASPVAAPAQEAVASASSSSSQATEQVAAQAEPTRSESVGSRICAFMKKVAPFFIGTLAIAAVALTAYGTFGLVTAWNAGVTISLATTPDAIRFFAAGLVTATTALIAKLALNASKA